MKNVFRIGATILIILYAISMTIYSGVKASEAENNLLIAEEQRIRAEQQLVTLEEMAKHADQNQAVAQEARQAVFELRKQLKSCQENNK